MKDLEKVSVQEQLEFIESFDHVLCDMDGVIWITYRPLPGVKEALECLKKLGKSVKFVTNNDFTEPDFLENRLAACFQGYTKDDIAQPATAIIDYLKSINFDRMIYLVSSKQVREQFEQAGFKLVDNPPQEFDESSLKGVLGLLEDNENVGCVVLLMDFNSTFIKLQKCITYLKRLDCMWIVGPPDKAVPIGPKGPVLGPHYYQQGLKEITGRDFVRISKPTKEFNDYFVKRFNLQDPKRVLFIGDSIETDMRMASLGGYRKLLVFTGMAKHEDVQKWSFEEELKPDYYIQSLDSLCKILKDITFSNKF